MEIACFLAPLVFRALNNDGTAAATQLLRRRRACGRSESFEVYGFDFLIGEDLKPWRPGLEHGRHCFEG